MKNTKLTAEKLIRSIEPISLQTVRSWIFQNKLPVVRLGRKVLVRKVVIEKIGIVRIFRSSLSIPILEIMLNRMVFTNYLFGSTVIGSVSIVNSICIAPNC